MNKKRKDEDERHSGFGQRGSNKEQRLHAKELVKKAVEKIKLGGLNEAERLLKQALEQEPCLTAARMVMGFIKKQKKDYIGALAEYKKCAEEGNEQAIASYNIGNIYRELGELPLAISSYEKALGKNPIFVDALTNLGLSLLESGSTEKAKETLEKAVRCNPSHVAALNNLGRAYIQSNRLTEAISTLRRAHKLGGEITEILQNIGTAYLLNKDRKEALRYFKQAVAANTNDVISLCGAAQCHALGGEYEPAIAYINRAMEIEPKNGSTMYQKATVLEAQGKKEECLLFYKRAATGQTYIHAAERKLSYYTDAKKDRKPLARALGRIGNCTNTKEAIELNYTIAKYKEDLGEKSAYSHYKLANELELQTSKYMELDEQLVIQGNEAFKNTSSGSKGTETLILLVGLPLSGGEVIENILKGSGIRTTMGKSEYNTRLEEYILDSNIYGLPGKQRECLERLQEEEASGKAIHNKGIFSFEYCQAATKIFPGCLIIECKMSAADNFLATMRSKSQAGYWGCGAKQIKRYLQYYRQVMCYQRKAVGKDMITLNMDKLKQNPISYWRKLMKETGNLRGLATSDLDSELIYLINKECQKLQEWPYEGTINKDLITKNQIENLLAE